MEENPIPDDPKRYDAYMRSEIVNFAKRISKYKNEIAKIYKMARKDLEKAATLSKDKLTKVEDGGSPPRESREGDRRDSGGRGYGGDRDRGRSRGFGGDRGRGFGGDRDRGFGGDRGRDRGFGGGRRDFGSRSFGDRGGYGRSDYRSRAPRDSEDRPPPRSYDDRPSFRRGGFSDRPPPRRYDDDRPPRRRYSDDDRPRSRHEDDRPPSRYEQDRAQKTLSRAFGDDNKGSDDN